MAARIRVVDIETIFEEPQPNSIVEIGYTDVISTGTDLLGGPTDWMVGETWSTLINPGQPVTPETQAIHHIADEDVQGSLPWSEVWPLVFRGAEHEGVIGYAAHGAKFERAFIGTDITGVLPWIDTYHCSLWVYPDSPSHSNQALRYYNKPVGLDRKKAEPTHRAGPDSYVTAFHVRDLLNAGHSIEKLVEWTNGPALLPRCKIGDDYRNGGKGTPWADVSDGMLDWVLRKMSGDPTRENEVFTARHHIEQREIDRRLERQQSDLDRQFVSNGMAPSNPLIGVDMAAGRDLTGVRVDVEDPALVPWDIWTSADRIISPTGKVLKERAPAPAQAEELPL